MQVEQLLVYLQTAEETVMTRVKSKQNKQENAALLHRVRFYINVFGILELLVPPMDQTSAAATAAQTPTRFVPNLSRARFLLRHCIAHLKGARDTVRFGRQPSTSTAISNSRSNNGDHAVDGDFSWLVWHQPRVNAHLLPPSFPREVLWVGRVDGFDFFVREMESLLELVDEAPDAADVLALQSILVS